MSYPKTRPGYKTTEFWLATAAAFVGILMASGAFGPESPVFQGLGVAATVLASMGYSVSRGAAKKGI